MCNRVLRKTDAVTARITDIENYRLQLLRVLHKRFDSTVSVISSDDNFSSVDHIITEQSLSASEKDSMALFISRFRIATYEEPPLLDFPSYFFGTVPISDGSEKPGTGAVNMVSRWGHMYVTHKDIFFHADAAAIRNVMGLFSKASSGEVIQLVLPISTISKCRCGHKISPAIASTLGKKKETAMELQDSVGNIYIFGMPAGSPPQYADRVCDLFTILQSCVLSGHDLNEPTAAPAPIEAVLAPLKSDIPTSSSISAQKKDLSVGSGSVATPTEASNECKSEQIAGKENGSILSSRKEAFSHVMKLASSALDSALPGKFRSAASTDSSASKVEGQLGSQQGSEEKTLSRRDDSVPKKKDVAKGDTEGWYQSAPIGASLSVSSVAHVSSHEKTRPAGSSPSRNVVTPGSETSGQAKAPSGSRPKPASLGKNIQVISTIENFVHSPSC